MDEYLLFGDQMTTTSALSEALRKLAATLQAGLCSVQANVTSGSRFFCPKKSSMTWLDPVATARQLLRSATK
jgi:hypothetical protein